MTIRALDHVQIAIPVGGEAEARVFYGDELELAEVTKPDALADRGGLWFTVGPIGLHLGVDRDFRPARKAHPALVVDDLAAIEARLRAAGRIVEDAIPLPGWTRLYVLDPFGNRVELMQRREASS